MKRRLTQFCLFTVLFLLVFFSGFGSFTPFNFEVKTVKALSLDLVSDIRERIDWLMTHYYTRAKDSDTWFFATYNAVSGAKTENLVNIGALQGFAIAYLATGNITYLQWLQNAWNAIISRDLVKSYCEPPFSTDYWYPIYIDATHKGHPCGKFNITSNSGNIYEGDVSTAYLPFIKSSILLYKETNNQTYSDSAKNFTDAYLHYRRNETTGWISNLYNPRYSNQWGIMSQHSWNLIISPDILNTLNLMYEVTSNSTYRDFVNKAWQTLIDKYPDGNWGADNFYINGTEISGSLKTLPDTIENYNPSMFYWPNQTLLDYFEKCWDKYYANWWSTDHFTAHTTSAWIGAEVNALIEMYLLNNNQTYLDWAKSNYNYWYNQFHSGTFIKYGGTADYAKVFGVYWDWQQAILRLWVATGNQTYYNHFVELWNNANNYFAKDYGYVTDVYLNGTVKTSTATIPINNCLNSMLFALITNENKHFAGYCFNILSKLKLIDSIDVFDITSTANITSTPTFTNQILTLTLSATSGRTSTTRVYCGDYGRPKNVWGASSWSYDSSTKIATINISHASSVQVTLSWVQEDIPIIPPGGSTDPLLIYFLEADVLGFVIACYTSRMGQGFYAVMLLIFFGVLYNRTKSLALCSILWLLLGGAWILTTFMVSPIAVILVALGLVGILYSIFGKVE